MTVKEFNENFWPQYNKARRKMYTNNFIQVGKNIQTFLSEKGKTQQNLADAMGISKQVMSKIINGNKAINVTEIAKIAEFLEVSVDDILQVDSATSSCESGVDFMGLIDSISARDKVEHIMDAIDEIFMLEELIGE